MDMESIMKLKDTNIRYICFLGNLVPEFMFILLYSMKEERLPSLLNTIILHNLEV